MGKFYMYLIYKENNSKQTVKEAVALVLLA